MPSAPGAEMIQQFSRGISVGRQAELDLHGADGIAGRGADHAIDLAHVEALLGEKLLQLLGLGQAQGLDRRIALAQRGRAGKTARVVGGRRRIDQRLVPFEIDVEIRIGEKGRAVPAHRQVQPTGTLSAGIGLPLV